MDLGHAHHSVVAPMNETLRHPVVLIIDSDPIILTGMAAVLDQSGYECHCAGNGEAARKAVVGIEPDLIICDVQVDGGLGIELCQELKRVSGLEDTPLMFLSSAQTIDIIRRVHDAGGVYYLRKPFDPWVLIELTDKALWMPHLVTNHIEQHHTPAPLGGPAALPSSPTPVQW